MCFNVTFVYDCGCAAEDPFLCNDVQNGRACRQSGPLPSQECYECEYEARGLAAVEPAFIEENFYYQLRGITQRSTLADTDDDDHSDDTDPPGWAQAESSTLLNPPTTPGSSISDFPSEEDLQLHPENEYAKLRCGFDPNDGYGYDGSPPSSPESSRASSPEIDEDTGFKRRSPEVELDDTWFSRYGDCVYERIESFGENGDEEDLKDRTQYMMSGALQASGDEFAFAY